MDLDFDKMLEQSRLGGIKTAKRQAKCIESGGHYRDKDTTVNGKKAWKCRCGLAAPCHAKIWGKSK